MGRKSLIVIVLPALLGILTGIIILAINPNAGRHVGDVLYSKGVNVDSYAYAVAKAAPSVVNIYVTSLSADDPSKDSGHENAEIRNSASGVIMRSDGYIVTNYHVVPSSNESGQAIWAMLRTGELYQAFVVGFDPRTDIAVLKVDAPDLKAIETQGVRHEPQVGDVVLAIGNPNNLGQTVTHGIISATARSGTGLMARNQMNIREGVQDLIQTDAPINNGNSGGALVNTAGELVGINTASFNGYQTYGIGFAVPTKLVTAVMGEIISHGRVIRGYLGISDDGSVPLPNNQGVGIRVGFVDPLGPAHGILEVGDVIYEVNTRRIGSLKEFIEYISSSGPGTKLSFKILRQDEELKLDVILSEDRVGVD
ncbi:MAG: trypsin-like peptidase domain-containing protein [Succinatimonas sp.]|nr:trypsin-like peptidase domain-containing protein [Succinatimonas sp.]